MTTKLFWQDSHLACFDARVVSVGTRDSDLIIELDQTAFYPTGGGQPCDLGRIDGVEVLEVEISEGERIYHRMKGNPGLEPGRRIKGEIDWKRRLEMMQQHTGQHILSQAFFQLFGAETRGFRIVDRSTEIDLALDMPPGEIEEAVRQAEDLANDLVFSDRRVRIHEVSPEEAAKLPLRKESFIPDCVRVVEIEDFDFSPCGGTHVRRTGEVGLIAIRGWERAKRMTRVHFVCGRRALLDYRSVAGVVDSLSRRLSVGRDEIEPSVIRLQDENKQLTRRVRELARLEADLEANRLLESAAETDGLRLVTACFDDRDVEEVKLTAHRLVDRERVIALLATIDGDAVRLVFARSSDLEVDLNQLMRTACQSIGGRGGGRPDFAMGGGPAPQNVPAFLDSLVFNCKDRKGGKD
ncbi:MAG: hypothetical protein IPM66_04555 [Acidobacteriota bacterium]|nr:MAG: hypothetical protein IPM66_04555 [Acidobacteriota bacterium]